MPNKNFSFEIQNIPFDFIWVEGTPENQPFLMGSEEYSREKPIHPVSLASFWIGKYPLTQAQWKTVMGEENNPSYFIGDDRPVESVSWDTITQEFLPRLNALLKEKGIAYGCKLPSEAQWEYAARGGKHWQEMLRYAGSNRLAEVGWYDDNSNQETKPVGLKMPNQLGIYDMSGNVWEWCEDDWHENYENAPKSGESWIEKNTNNTKKVVVVRGGSWLNFVIDCRSTYRVRYRSVNISFIFGCRLVLFPL
ncbi:MAG: formylglycine-generating enzyme family protein [Bacteroidia bacterium]